MGKTQTAAPDENDTLVSKMESVDLLCLLNYPYLHPAYSLLLLPTGEKSIINMHVYLFIHSEDERREGKLCQWAFNNWCSDRLLKNSWVSLSCPDSDPSIPINLTQLQYQLIHWLYKTLGSSSVCCILQGVEVCSGESSHSSLILSVRSFTVVLFLSSVSLNTKTRLVLNVRAFFYPQYQSSIPSRTGQSSLSD